MFDLQLRRVKDQIFRPIAASVPGTISPLRITFFGFCCGLASCHAAFNNHVILSLVFWLLNRVLDCLDGAVAHQRNVASHLGGFLDLLADFIVYSLIPIAIAAGQSRGAGGGKSAEGAWPAVAVLESTFHVNNFVLFYIAGVIEGLGADRALAKMKLNELTTRAMKPALIEGFESAVLFTGMLLTPWYIGLWSWVMAGLVAIGIIQRVIWVTPILAETQSALN